MDKEEMTRKNQPRKLKELNLLDDFLFQEMVSQEKIGEEFCRILLSTIFDKPIRKVRVIPQKNILGVDTDKHGIRMDAYIEENIKELDAEIIPDIYDIEPDKVYEKGKKLPRRMRYYHGLIDTKFLTVGTEYNKLPNVVIIVILPYDPFDKNRMVYTVQNQCVEDSTIPYDDGAKKVFLYTKGMEGNPSQKLRDMLKYIEKTTEDNITNQDIETIHRLVNQVKSNEEVGINYMKSWEREKMIREEGITQGIENKTKTVIRNMLKTGAADEDICEMVECDLKMINEIRASMEKTKVEIEEL